MRRFIQYLTLLVCAVMYSALCRAQGNIYGTVKDSTFKAIPFATVSLKNNIGNAIVAYTTTDDKGVYNLIVPSGGNADSMLLEARCIGYKSQIKIVTTTPPINFMLRASVNQLDAVVIRSTRPVLRVHGDTLAYKVSDFSNPQDRVIGDVIKKLPGISVATDGTISYNNKPVSNVYIGGDNLLDDKYSIATSAIPHGAVDQVQVIENDQHIKALQNKVTSEDVALNLTFKKDAKLQLVGQESLGAGLPGNYFVDLNAMMFKDTYKAINYLKGNNTGYDLQQDLLSHTYADYIQRIDNAVPATVLSLGAVNDPALARDRYLFDRSGIVNLNNLINLKNNEQLRVNAYYLHDAQHQDYSQQTTIFLPHDTVRYNETQHNRTNPDILHSQFTLNINRDKYYLNDILRLDDNRATSYSGLNTNGTRVNQAFKDNALNFSNEFNLIKSLKSNNIMQAYFYVSHSTEPENRVINPGYNASVFDSNVPYRQLLQNVNIPAWYTNSYLSLKIPSDLITQSFRTGFSVQSQTLTSQLDVVQSNNTVNSESDSALNYVNWTKKKLYGEVAFDLPGKILKVNLTLPVTLQQIRYSDTLYALNKGLIRLYFNPQLQLKYQTGLENYLTLLYNYRNETGTIQDIYRGYILNDYRTLYANNASLTERQNQLAAFGFNYRKAVTLFFWSINALYDHTRANNVASSIITNSFQQRVMLPFANSTGSWTLNGSVSKYSFSLHTTFSASILWQTKHSVQIQNEALLPFNTTSSTANMSADTKVNSKVTLNYKVTISQTASHSANDAAAYKIEQLLQQASFNYDPSEYLLFKLSGEHYFTHQQGSTDLKYFFADASARFRINKWKTDMEISAVNFLNVKTYNALSLSANTLTASSYSLPGRIIVFKALFNL